MSAPAEMAAGVIHDIGYRHYGGPRLGRWHAAVAVYLHTLRGMYGLGRPARAKVVPLLLFVITFAPGAVSGAITAAVGLPSIPYAHYAYFLQVAIIVFVAAQVPQVVTGDIRFRALSLYFSRPLERADYVWAKLAAIATGIFALIAAPLLAIFLCVILSRTTSFSFALEEAGRLGVGLTGAAVHAVLLGSLAMAISALTRVRAFAIVGIVGLYLVTSSVVGIMLGVSRGGELGIAFGLISPFSLLDGFQVWALRAAPTVLSPGRLGWVFGMVTVAVIAASVGLLHWRYRRIAS